MVSFGSNSGQLRRFSLIAICMELFSGLMATIWTSFFNEKAVDKWAYIIFISYILFVSAMAFPTIKELQVRRFCKAPIDDANPTATTHFILWAWTLVTLGVNLAVCYYNEKILNQSVSNVILILAFICYGFGASMFLLGYCLILQLSATVAQYLIIFGLGIDLLSGILVASLPPILNYEHVDVRDYIVLVVYAAFALATLYFFIKEVLSGYQKTQYVQLCRLFVTLLVTLFYGFMVVFYMVFDDDDPDESKIKVSRTSCFVVIFVTYSLGVIILFLAFTPPIAKPTSQSDPNIEGGSNEQMTYERVNVDEEYPGVN